MTLTLTLALTLTLTLNPDPDLNPNPNPNPPDPNPNPPDPNPNPNQVFGLAEGKVKVGQLRSNKPATLYSTDSYVVSICANQEGSAVLSGHLDHRIYRFYFDPAQQRGGTAHWELCRHSCVPYALSWGMAVCVAGNDQVISFYHKDYQP